VNRNVVLATDRQLLPSWTGNRVRILGLMRHLRALGLRIIVVATPQVGPLSELRHHCDGFVRVRARAFVGGDIDRFDPRPFRRAVEGAVRKFHAEIVVAEYAWLAPVFARLGPNVARWVDCHDLLHERTNRFLSNGLDPWVTCTRAQEFARLSLADVIIATQECEASALRAALPTKQIVCLPPAFDMTPAHPVSRDGYPSVLMVGANHPGNRGLAQFANEAWPRVRARVPHARLQVVGGIGEAVTVSPGIEVKGYVEDLQALYAAATVVVCPITVGTGVKVKMLEALRFGKAVVVTPMAEEGLYKATPRAWVTADSLFDCADETAALLVDDEARVRLEAAALAFGEQHLSSAAFEERLRAVLTDKRSAPPNRVRGHREGSSLATLDKSVELALDSATIVVPCLGWPQTLGQCIDSLRTQVVDIPFEIILVINGPADSDDHPSWPGVTVVHEPKRGPAAARNAGARLAKGDALAFVDADCRAEPGWLASSISTLRATRGTTILAGAISRFGADRNWVSLYDSATYLQQKAYVRGPRAFVTANLVVHRKVFECVGPFDERFQEAAFEDWDWAMRARRLDIPVRYDEGSVVLHPCMSQLEELKRKAERLARGEIVMKMKTRARVAPSGLLQSLSKQWQRAFRNKTLTPADRVRVMCIGSAVAFWGWRAARDAVRNVSARGLGQRARSVYR
jgi:GT2 family glycosyltransferase/glycosyltransferase involved in cell wall biosynthesis